MPLNPVVMLQRSGDLVYTFLRQLSEIGGRDRLDDEVRSR